MKKIVFSLITILSVCFFASCRDRQTYADQKEAERSAINKFIADSAVKVISETTFASQDYTTNVAQNEYVLLSVPVCICKFSAKERVRKLRMVRQRMCCVALQSVI